LGRIDHLTFFNKFLRKSECGPQTTRDARDLNHDGKIDEADEHILRDCVRSPIAQQYQINLGIEIITPGGTKIMNDEPAPLPYLN